MSDQQQQQQQRGQEKQQQQQYSFECECHRYCHRHYMCNFGFGRSLCLLYVSMLQGQKCQEIEKWTWARGWYGLNPGLMLKYYCTRTKLPMPMTYEKPPRSNSHVNLFSTHFGLMLKYYCTRTKLPMSFVCADFCSVCLSVFCLG